MGIRIHATVRRQDRFQDFINDQESALCRMLNHSRHEISPVAVGPNIAQFDVLLETSGEILLFQWGVEKVESGEFASSWMTVAVSMQSFWPGS